MRFSECVDLTSTQSVKRVDFFSVVAVHDCEDGAKEPELERSKFRPLPASRASHHRKSWIAFIFCGGAGSRETCRHLCPRGLTSLVVPAR